MSVSWSGGLRGSKVSFFRWQSRAEGRKEDWRVNQELPRPRTWRCWFHPWPDKATRTSEAKRRTSSAKRWYAVFCSHPWAARHPAERFILIWDGISLRGRSYQTTVSLIVSSTSAHNFCAETFLMKPRFWLQGCLSAGKAVHCGTDDRGREKAEALRLQSDWLLSCAVMDFFGSALGVFSFGLTSKWNCLNNFPAGVSALLPDVSRCFGEVEVVSTDTNVSADSFFFFFFWLLKEIGATPRNVIFFLRACIEIVKELLKAGGTKHKKYNWVLFNTRLNTPVLIKYPVFFFFYLFSDLYFSS